MLLIRKTLADVTDRSTPENTSTGAVPFTVGDAETPAGSLTVTAASSNPALIPVSGIAIGGSGANRTVTVTPGAGQSGSATITLTVHDDGGLTASDTFVLTVTVPPPPPPPVAAGQPFAVGSDAGRAATVTMFNPNGTVRFAVQPFGPTYTAGVRVATGDVTGDGVPDVAAGTEAGAARAVVIDGRTGAVRRSTASCARERSSPAAR